MKPDYKKLEPNSKLSKTEAKSLAAFYRSLNHESVPTGKLTISGMNGNLYEWEGMPGKYFYKSADGMELLVVDLKVSEVKG
jgi:hypothetical protein